MGSPSIFSGKRTKLLTSEGILTKSGRTLDYDGAINYISNGNAEINTDGWITYDDSAASDKTRPADGTSVSSPTNIAWTRTTTTPIRGNASFLFAKTGSANCQGKGVSYEFSHPGFVEGNAISFEYQVLSGVYATGDIRIYLVDATQSPAVVIEPVNVEVENVGVISRHIATFQTNLNSTSYRLCIHVASTTIQNFELEFDSFELGPKPAPIGGALVAFKASRTNTITVSDNAEAKMTFNAASIENDTDGMYSTSNDRVEIKTPGYYVISGRITWVISDSREIQVIIKKNGSAIASQVQRNTTFKTAEIQVSTEPIFCKAGDYIELFGYHVDVVASNTLGATSYSLGLFLISSSFASADSGRVVAAKMYRDAAANLAPNNTSVKVSLDATEFDTVGGANTSQGRYDIKESGYYDIWGQVSVNASNVTTSAYFSRIYLNGNPVKSGVSNYQSSATQGMRLGVQAKLLCQAGDYIELYFFGQANHSTSQLSVTVGALTTTLEIHKISSGSMAISPGEFVGAKYQTDAGQSISNNTSTIIDFEDKIFDTHNAVTTGASWKFSAPMAGYYLVECWNQSANGGGWAVASEYWQTTVHKNGNATARQVFYQPATHTARVNGTIVDIVQLNQGEYVDIRVTQTSGAALALNANAPDNSISIIKVG